MYFVADQENIPKKRDHLLLHAGDKSVMAMQCRVGGESYVVLDDIMQKVHARTRRMLKGILDWENRQVNCSDRRTRACNHRFILSREDTFIDYFQQKWKKNYTCFSRSA